MGLLRTLSTIIAIFVDNPEILAGVEASITPAIDVVFHGANLDFLEDVLDVIVTCTFVRRQVSEHMWAYFPLLYGLFCTECFDYFEGVHMLLSSAQSVSITLKVCFCLSRPWVPGF